jgi:hypothetical protein
MRFISSPTIFCNRAQRWRAPKPTTPCRTPDSPVLYVEIQFIAHAVPSARDAMRRVVLKADQQINRRVKIIGLA